MASRLTASTRLQNCLNKTWFGKGSRRLDFGQQRAHSRETTGPASKSIICCITLSSRTNTIQTSTQNYNITREEARHQRYAFDNVVLHTHTPNPTLGGSKSTNSTTRANNK
eukprot:762110-Amphidinium_carterae.1